MEQLGKLAYEKKYLEVLERAKYVYSTADSVADKELMECIFPELTGSEGKFI